MITKFNITIKFGDINYLSTVYSVLDLFENNYLMNNRDENIN